MRGWRRCVPTHGSTTSWRSWTCGGGKANDAVRKSDGLALQPDAPEADRQPTSDQQDADEHEAWRVIDFPAQDGCHSKRNCAEYGETGPQEVPRTGHTSKKQSSKQTIEGSGLTAESGPLVRPSIACVRRSTDGAPARDQARSKRSRFMTLSHAATKSRTNFSPASSAP